MMKWRIYLATIMVVILLSAGTAFYSQVEGWSLVDSFYFSTIMLTTIGFGDLVPTSDFAKLFTAFYSLFGIGVMLYLLSSVIGFLIFKQEKFAERLSKFFEKNSKSKKREVIRVERKGTAGKRK